MREPTERMIAAAEVANDLNIGEHLNRLLYHLAYSSKSPIPTTTAIGVAATTAARWNVRDIVAQWNLVFSKKKFQLVICTNQAGDYAEDREKHKFFVLFVISEDRCVYQHFIHRAYQREHYETHTLVWPENLRTFVEGNWIADLINLVEIFDAYPSYLREKKEAARLAKIDANIHLKK